MNVFIKNTISKCGYIYMYIGIRVPVLHKYVLRSSYSFAYGRAVKFSWHSRLTFAACDWITIKTNYDFETAIPHYI